jgi:hypothetical protein
MSCYQLGWVDVALDQFVALSPEHQHLIDSRIAQLLDNPDDPAATTKPPTTGPPPTPLASASSSTSSGSDGRD